MSACQGITCVLGLTLLKCGEKDSDCSECDCLWRQGNLFLLLLAPLWVCSTSSFSSQVRMVSRGFQASFHTTGELIQMSPDALPSSLTWGLGREGDSVLNKFRTFEPGASFYCPLMNLTWSASLIQPDFTCCVSRCFLLFFLPPSCLCWMSGKGEN